jgi:hypothetical protein
VFIASFSFFCAVGVIFVFWLFSAHSFRRDKKELSSSLWDKALSANHEIAAE